jgi:hypothetical protein
MDLEFVGWDGYLEDVDKQWTAAGVDFVVSRPKYPS